MQTLFMCAYLWLMLVVISGLDRLAVMLLAIVRGLT